MRQPEVSGKQGLNASPVAITTAVTTADEEGHETDGLAELPTTGGTLDNQRRDS